MAQLKVTLKRSLIGYPETQRRTVKALGLGKLNSFSILPDDPCVRGQIFKVKHLVECEEIEGEYVKKVRTKKKVSTEKKVEQQEVEA